LLLGHHPTLLLLMAKIWHADVEDVDALSSLHASFIGADRPGNHSSAFQGR